MRDPNPSRPTDEALMAGYQRGHADAFATLFDRYRDRVYGFLVQQVGDRERAGDLFQETFLRLHDSRRRYDPGRPFDTWLFRIARNLAANERRRRGRSRETTTGPEALSEVMDPGTDEDPVETAQTRDRLQTALGDLPDEQREAIAMSFFGDLKYRQIADVVGASEDAVKQRVRRGLSALRTKLASPSGECSAAR